MSIAVLIGKNVKGDITKLKTNAPILEIEKKDFSKFKTYSVLILLTKKILSRKNTDYKKVLLFTKKNNIKLIEVAFEKSNISQEKSFSEAIIHGFESNTLKVIKKIIRDLEIYK
ncbi:MAG: hypothetical protein CMJ06_01580 [Pelagibacterales bacterium]|mgnify:CR=1 FL=1|nr:hypothetical protein [Pelagibacterales bacterium]OUU63352.1 MAG: hypothetical protein CBC22_01550 [Alphaproteobacteria bacterium TMED62]|tara:strand:- start:11146 stop:11487 length:342 start_codon:yes stop_codon:yes gene_type:complete